MPHAWVNAKANTALIPYGTDTDKSVWLTTPDKARALLAAIEAGTAPEPIGRVFVRDVTVPSAVRVWDIALTGEEPEHVGARDSYGAASELARTARVAKRLAA